MKSQFMGYRYEKVELAKTGDYRTWRYNIQKLETGDEFVYQVKIDESALSCRGLPTQIQDAVDTQGDSLFQKGLRQALENRIDIEVSTIRIIAKVLVDGGWREITSHFL
jgi:hypothetical protein